LTDFSSHSPCARSRFIDSSSCIVDLIAVERHLV
jgi:hypothetical protein